MNLTELEPQFVRYDTREGRDYIVPVNTLAEAQGVQILCPLCFAANNGPVGTHALDVTFAGRGAADHQGSHADDGKPSRWNVTGDSFENLSTTPSIHLKGSGCGWHGFITNGEIR